MTEPLKIDVDDDHLWRTTLEAVAATQDRKRPRVTILCKGCGTVLGALDVMPQGPLMGSWWDAQWPEDEVMKVITSAGPVDVYEWARAMPGTREYGRPPRKRQRMSMFALLGSDLPEHPALLVRCDKHGDLVVDRADALDQLAATPPGSHRKWKVLPEFPRREYLPPRDDQYEIVPGEKQTFTQVTTLRPGHRTAD